MIYYSKKEGGFFLTKETTDCVKISSEEHARLLAGQRQGKEIVADKNGYPTLQEPIKADLNTIKNSLKSLIDNTAERERLKYITDGVGQSMTYQEKVNQAASYTAAFYAHKADEKLTPPNEAEYPLLQASLGVDGDTLADVAEMITYAYAMWQQVGAAIEGTRLKAKKDIDEAKTVEAAQAAFDAITWPTPS